MKQVSVVIPSFNRGRLLPQILPTYFQAEVGEVILVDDASADDTPQVVAELQKQYPSLRYVRLPENRRQMYAKNQGIQLAAYPYIYFGDDDSFLTAGSIGTLLAVMQEKKADIVGAKALYMDSQEDLQALPAFLKKYEKQAHNAREVVDLTQLRFNFTLSSEQALRVPVTHACFLIRTEWARAILFDEAYRWNAYREETDFLIRACLAGAVAYYQPAAIQINLPREMATGGAHSQSKWKWHVACIINNWYFLNKNYAAMQEQFNLPYSKWMLQLRFVCRGVKKTVERFWGGRR